MSQNYSVDSTIYRRRSDGTLVGTPENAATPARPAHLDPAVAVVPVTPLPEAFQPIEQSQPVEPAAHVAETPVAHITPTPIPAYTYVEHELDAEEIQPEVIVKPPREKRFQRKVKKEASTFRKSPAGKLLHRIFAVLRIVVVAYIAVYIALGVWTSKSLEKTNATPKKPIAVTAGTNWLLLGSDSRRGLSTHMQKVLHTGPDSGSERADVIMIVHIDAKGQPTLVSLPRDSYVTIPAHTSSDGTKVGKRHNKINAAYSFGGAPLLVATVEANTGLHIDHYMEIGFAGIKEITDAVHGVTICVPHNYDDQKSNLHVKKGCQHMNGKKTLAYVRMRYADPKGDLGRIQRQQQFISAVLHKVAMPSTLLNPFAMKNLSAAGTSSVIVGQTDGLSDIAKLGMAMRNISKGHGKVMTVPISDPNATTAAGSSVLWNHKKADQLFKSLGAR